MTQGLGQGHTCVCQLMVELRLFVNRMINTYTVHVGEQQLFLQVSHKFHSNLRRSYDTSAPLVVTSVYGLISVPCLTI